MVKLNSKNGKKCVEKEKIMFDLIAPRTPGFMKKKKLVSLACNVLLISDVTISYSKLYEFTVISSIKHS